MDYTTQMMIVQKTEVFEGWLVGLRDRIAQTRILARITRMELGNFGDHKSVGDGVSEIRVDHGPGYRVYYTERAGVIVILLCGGDKSTQSQDIRNAQAMTRKLNQERM
jgi:putative addiction module killer protein